MSIKKKNRTESPEEKKALQIRVPTDDERGAQLVAKMEEIAKRNGISANAVANFAIAAGINMVEIKLKEIHDQAPAEAA